MENFVAEQDGSTTIRAKRGDTFPAFTLQFTDENGDPIDITGRTYTLEVRPKDRRKRNKKTVYLRLVFGTDITISDAASGIISFANISASRMEIEPGCHEYDLQENNGGGNYFR